ncbi:MAG: polyphenol oxidase family protein, partial [Candidatus Omnitrophica bacterium]|nr:polyphenol oxidase family protein [Candidatus Omnitrophota bacterium]
FVFLNQVHGDIVHYVETSDCGKALQVSVLDGDAMFTDQPGICLAIMLADCVGVIIFDTEKDVAGICHSGWKGCLLNICGKLVDKMVEGCGCKADKLVACVSPSICYKCYKVSARLAEKFASVYGDFIIKNNKFHLDLKGIVISQITAKGINRSRIFTSDICTSENTHIFYSYRTEKETGRFMFGVYMKLK